MSPKWGAIAAGLVLFLATSIPTALIEYRLLDQKRAAARQTSERTARQIGQQLAQVLAPAYALGALVREGNGAIRDFDSIAREFIALTPGVSSLQLAPGGVVRQVVPLAGNEKAIGHNLLTDEKRNREARLAIATGKLTLAGPFELIQGGVAVIGRLPVFLDTPMPRTFWGFTSALIRVPELLATTRINTLPAEGYSFELSRIHPDSGERHVFARSRSGLTAGPLTSVIDVPNGRWMLSVTPATGWISAPRMILEIVVLAILSALATWFAKRSLGQRQRVETALNESRERFRLFMDNSPTIAWIKDEEGRHLYLSRAFEERFGVRLEDWRGKTDAELWPPDTAAECRKSDLAVLALGQPLQVTEQAADRNGNPCYWFNTKFPFADAAGRRYVAGIGLDVTERKESERALRASEKRFQDVVAASADSVWELDAEYRFTYVSDTGEAMLGYRLGELLGRTPFDFMPEDEAARVAAAFAAIAARREAFRDLDNIRRHRDGRLRHIRTTGMPILDRDGRLLGYRGLDRDVTEPKLAELALRESETRLRTLVDTIPDLVWLKDPHGVYLFCNRRFEDLYGHDEADILGRNDYDFADRELADFFRARDRAAIAAGGPTMNEEEVAFARDGHRELLQTIKTPIHDQNGKLIGVLGVARDITELRQNENELEAHRQHLAELVEQRAREVATERRRLNDIIEGTNVGTWAWNVQTGETIFNERWAQIVGYTLADLAPVGIDTWVKLAHPDDLKHSGELLARHFAGDLPFYECEARMKHRDGRWVWVLDRGKVSSRTEDGKPLLMSGTHQDITLRKEVEQELIQAKEAAEAAAMAKSTFLANMSHEIRTPLNAVLGFARIGQRDSAGGAAAEAFSQILASGEHLLGVINDVLDYSKIEAGKLSVEARPFQLCAAVANAGAFVAGAAGQKGIGYSAILDPDLPAWVLGDAQRVQQILANLLSNAVKFTEAGEVRLEVARAGPDIRFRLSDTGIGMTEEQLSRLYLPFEQADGSTTRRFGGSGLGLAISRQLVHLMDGEIAVDSIPGKGSTFCLRLPLAETATPRPVPAEPPTPDARRLAQVRVLAAEDVEVNRMILEDMLLQEGAEVRFAGNGREALELVHRLGPRAFEIALMDVQMPEMDGYSATRELRRLAPGLPVIGLTAHALAEERARCLEAGMVEHLAKPIDPEQLVAAIRRHWVPRTAPAPRASPPVPDAAAALAAETDPGQRPETAALMDWPGLLQRFAGRRAFVDRLVALAVETLAQTPARLRQVADADDAETLAFMAHSLKGTAGNLMAQSLYDLALATEQAARGESPEAFRLARDLEQATERLLAELAERSGLPVASPE